MQYADFSVWQSRRLSGETLQREIEHWRQKLAGAPPFLELPTDRPRPPVQTFGGRSLPLWLEPGLTGRLSALALATGTTLFMVLLAGFETLLGIYSGAEDLAVGTPIAGRNRAELEGLIGFFVNSLVLRGDLSGDPSFVDLLGRVREDTLSAYTHQDLPFEKLVEEVKPERSRAHSPIFQVMFALQNAPMGGGQRAAGPDDAAVGRGRDGGEVRPDAGADRRERAAGSAAASNTTSICSTRRRWSGCSIIGGRCSRGWRRTPDHGCRRCPCWGRRSGSSFSASGATRRPSPAE